MQLLRALRPDKRYYLVCGVTTTSFSTSPSTTTISPPLVPCGSLRLLFHSITYSASTFVKGQSHVQSASVLLEKPYAPRLRILAAKQHAVSHWCPVVLRVTLTQQQSISPSDRQQALARQSLDLRDHVYLVQRCHRSTEVDSLPCDSMISQRHVR